MPPKVTRAVSTLRTEHFQTIKRERTNKLLLTYTGHVPDPRIDAHYVDSSDAMKSYFGITYHYIIKTNGDIEVGRNPLTCSTGSRQKRFQKGAIFIGIVGGLAAETGYRKDTITPEQEASLEWLMQVISNNLEVELEVVDYIEGYGASRSDAAGSRAARNNEVFNILYSEMTDEELAASPDRLKF